MKSIKTFAISLAVALIGLMAFAPAVYAQNLPPTYVYAREYAGWQIQGQAANSFSWNGGVCNYTPLTSTGLSSPIFDFSGVISASVVYNPVLITDAVSTNSEIVTPTATTQGSSSCGFAAAPSNPHVSFTVSSGTVGLQEAISANVGSTVPIDVLVDRWWYTQEGSLPGSPSAATMIANAKGSTLVNIVDISTAPWTWYVWNSSHYVAASYPAGAILNTLTETTAAPGTARTITGQITTSNASYANGGNSLVGVRGLVTIGSGTTIASGYLYGTQGKVILGGTSNTQSGGGIISGIFGQLDLTGATLTNTGDTAPGAFDMGSAGPTATIGNLSGVLITNSTPTKAGQAIHVATTSAGFVDFFTIDDTSQTLATTTGTPGTCTNSGYLNVKVNGTALKIPFCQ